MPRVDIEGKLRRQIAQLEGLLIAASATLDDDATTWRILSEASWIQAPEFSSVKALSLIQVAHLREASERTRDRANKIIAS